MNRHVAWIRKERSASIQASFRPVSTKAHLGMEDLGMELVTGAPLYDNGLFFVVDTVKDLEFTILWEDEHGHPREIRRVRLDKYEAIRIADEMKEAELRADR